MQTAHVGVSRSLQLAFLAPDLVAAILDGTQPVALSPERLKCCGGEIALTEMKDEDLLRMVTLDLKAAMED